MLQHYTLFKKVIQLFCITDPNLVLAGTMINTERTIRLDRRRIPACGARSGDLLAGRFRLAAPLGWGGQAVVFQAYDQQRRNALVAVKLARRDLKPDMRQEAEDVLRWEAGLLRRLRHPALPRLYHLYHGNDGVWLARDAASGASLLDLGGQGLIDPQQVRSWALQICDLLSYLHTREVPVVCGDIKPANLILRSDGSLMLIDLGAATTLTRRPPRKARPRHGTPGYAAPEQLAGRPLDERSDLFALGATCYELLTGIDPATTPLQFDGDRLRAAAPRLAPALIWALQLELADRCPSAAVLRARLGSPQPPKPLRLGMGVAIVDQHDLDRLIQRHPQLIEEALGNGALERWLALHPDQSLAHLRYRLRTARRERVTRRRPIDLLLYALAPHEGSNLLTLDPPRLDLGDIPLRSWRVWSRPQLLTMRNNAHVPLRWSLTCVQQPDADLRLLIDGRPQRTAAGVIAPGAVLRFEALAMGKAGLRTGRIVLQSGVYQQEVGWQANATAGVPVGGTHVARLEDLNLARRDLVPSLDQLLQQGAMVRWLRSTKRRKLADHVAQALRAKPDELTRYLLIGQILHTLDPFAFPSLRVRPPELVARRTVVAGHPARAELELYNAGSQPCALVWRPGSAWMRLIAAPTLLSPQQTLRVGVQLEPPIQLAGTHQRLTLDLMAGQLALPLTIELDITVERWWQRLWRVYGAH
jgi:serine/threonine protein kinase